MGLSKLIKKAGKFIKKAAKVAGPVAIAAVAGPAAAPLLAQGAGPLGGALGGGAKPAGTFDPQSVLSGLANKLLESGASKAECAILGTCGQKAPVAAAGPAAVAVKSETGGSVSPLLIVGGLVALWLILRR